MKEAFLEIRTEEIPSGYISGALRSLKENASSLFEEYRIDFREISVYATPRRLILHVQGMAESQKSIIRKSIGPPTRIAFDQDGKPTPAALGFAKNQNTTVEKLQTEVTSKGEYLASIVRERGKKTGKLLSEIFPKILSNIKFPKYMRWGTGKTRFVRPIHSIAALFAGELVRFNVEGIKSGNATKGHRFLAPKVFSFDSYASYVKKLGTRSVIINPDDRKKIIQKESQKLASRVKGSPLRDDELFETLTYMTEFPIPVQGSFDEKFLKLPHELLIAVMKKHQRYLSVVDEKGKLMPHFIGVSDNKVKNRKTVRVGFERVLKARLADAQYFYDEDTKIPFSEYAGRLDSVVWLKKLGSIAEKVKRVKKFGKEMALSIAPSRNESVVRAAELCKGDLLTQMVYEFPELQGIMGREYARISKEEREVSDAIYEHYLPRFSGDLLPRSQTGALLSVADKMDSIAGCFLIGLIPTGSEDPYALRRQALGTMNILIRKGWEVSLNKLIGQALDGYPPVFSGSRKEAFEKIQDFLKQRLKNQLIGEGYHYDAVDAVFSVSFDVLCNDVKKVAALSGLKKEPWFESLTIAFKRVCNITKDQVYPPPDEGLFEVEAERKLYGIVNGIRSELEEYIEKKEFGKAFKKVCEIKEPVDLFFDEVLVMAEDRKIRDNRLGLLTMAFDLFRKIADFTKIVVK